MCCAFELGRTQQTSDQRRRRPLRSLIAIAAAVIVAVAVAAAAMVAGATEPTHDITLVARDMAFYLPQNAQPNPPLEVTREEQVRQQLKSLVQRDTIARAAEAPESLEDMSLNLLVRFARLREARNFSHALADALGSSRWLSERIMLDLSGQQLATALMALGAAPADGEFMLAQLYPHLNAAVDGKTRAQVLWEGLDPERCDERMLAWLRADDEAEGRTPMAEAANANDEAEGQVHVERPAFGRRRAAGMRR